MTDLHLMCRNWSFEALRLALCIVADTQERGASASAAIDGCPGRQIPAIPAERNEKERWHDLCFYYGRDSIIRPNGEHAHGNAYVDI